MSYIALSDLAGLGLSGVGISVQDVESLVAQLAAVDGLFPNAAQNMAQISAIWGAVSSGAENLRASADLPRQNDLSAFLSILSIRSGKGSRNLGAFVARGAPLTDSLKKSLNYAQGELKQNAADALNEAKKEAAVLAASQPPPPPPAAPAPLSAPESPPAELPQDATPPSEYGPSDQPGSTDDGTMTMVAVGIGVLALAGIAFVATRR